MPKFRDPEHEVLEKDIHALREDVQSLKLAYGFKETYNNEFRKVVQDETCDIRQRTEDISTRFAGIDGKLTILLWIFGIFSAGIISLVVLVVLFLLKN